MIRQRVRAILAVTGLFLAVAGVPWLLYALGGGPPTSLPNAHQVHRFVGQPITDTALVRAVSLVCWTVWALFVAAVAAEAAAWLQGRPSPSRSRRGIRIPGLQGPAGALFLTALLLLPQRPGGPAGSTRTPIPLAAPATANLMVPPSDTVRLADAVTAAEMIDETAPLSPVSGWTPYTVQRYDTLWAIAETHLGDPLRWREIKDAAGHSFATGGDASVYVNGTVIDEAQSRTIYPGQIVYLPPQTNPVREAPARPPTATRPAGTQSAGRAIPPDVLPSGRVPSAPTPESAPPAIPTPGHIDGRPTAHGTSTGWVTLASGSRLGGAFAAGVVAALAAVRLRARRAYRPRPPRPGQPLAAPPPPPGLADLLRATRTTPDDSDGMPTNTVAGRPLEPLTALPDREARLRPDVIEIASRGDETVTLALCDWPDLTLSGLGAEAALRAWIGAILVRNGPYGADLLVEASVYDRLFPAVDLPSLQHVTDFEDLLSRLEAQIVARARRLEEADVSDAAAYRRQHPAEPFPLLVAVTERAADSHPRRWSALIGQAARLGVTTITVRPDLYPHHPAIPAARPRASVAADGTVEQAAPELLARHLAGGRLFQITTAEGADLLRPVAIVHNDDTSTDVATSEPPATSGTAAAATAANGHAMPQQTDEELPAIWPTPSDAQSQVRPIRVRLLGPAEVEAWGQPINRGLRASAYELLAWYALHPQGATAEAAIDAIWPDANLQRGRERFWTALGNLRSRLRSPTGDTTEILIKVGDHYRPDTSLLDIDIWRFEAALAEAVRATDSEETIETLKTAVAAYRGDLTPNLDNVWVEPVREDLHRRAIDVHVRLAERYLDDDNSEPAIETLERAIQLDPICEAVYRRLITVQANLGRFDAAQRTWRLLQGRLAELELEPEPETARLALNAMTLTADPASIATVTTN